MIFKLYFVFLRKFTTMAAKELLIKNIDMLCYERKWNRRALAKKMGIMEASLSRSLNGNPTLETLEKIAKALDVSIKSLFNDPADVEGFVLLKGKPYHFNSQAEFELAFKESRPNMGVHCTTTSGDGKS